MGAKSLRDYNKLGFSGEKGRERERGESILSNYIGSCVVVRVRERKREREREAENIPSLNIRGCAKVRVKERERAWGLTRCGIGIGTRAE
jgi:hypothetical protein